MHSARRNPRLWTAFAITVNAVLVFCVVISVILAFSNAEKVSLSQNVENVRTLTNSSANKVELVIANYTKEVKMLSDYINSYNQKGMTLEEIYSYISDYYSLQDSSVSNWQLVDSENNGKIGSSIGYNSVTVDKEKIKVLTYTVQNYPELAKIFCVANESTIGQIGFTSEFTDPSPALAKSFAITTTLRIRDGEEYQYKTLMLLIKSEYITRLISNNNEIDTLSFFGYSNIIIDNSGDYVISDSHFQGTNFIEYVGLYDKSFTAENADELKRGMNTEDYSNVLFYKNSRGQDCVYTIVPVQNSNWHILSIVPVASFHNAYNFNGNFIVFAVFFSLLFIVDILFVLFINRQLRHRTKEAQAANEAKTRFLSSMSHDIRTPMNAIIGMTTIADDILDGENPDMNSLRDCISTIKTSGGHLVTLINDILDISKIENGKVVMSPDDFCISNSIAKMLEIVQPQIKEKNLTLESHIINVTHEYVCSDELRINQIFINILSNAIKYTNNGGKIKIDFIEEEIPNCSDKARFVYRVADTGIGMDKEFLKNIFDRFSRAVDTRVNTTQGTGLGMAISKQLVELLGGTIEVESELNVGSVFTVTLELAIAAVPDDSITLDGISALLIDDDSVLLETAKTSLEKAGMIVDTALNGADGIRMALTKKQDSTSYDIILVDWKMAPMCGAEVVQMLHSGLDGQSKIIVMTAYSIAEIEHEARLAGADAMISKPLFRSRLLQKVQNLITDESNKAPIDNRTEVFDLSVLVAEDNNVNWKVMSRILIKYGINPDRAENGQIAVNMVQSGSYDLVLMDIQMPVMNGYDATAAIRQLDDINKAHVPIYAMTADTFAEDIARCLEKGMNGHLSKPIEIDKLLKVLTLVNSRKHKDNIKNNG